MKFLKLILLSVLTLFLTFTLSYASSAIKKPFVKNQQLNPGLDAQVRVVSMTVKNDISYYFTYIVFGKKFNEFKNKRGIVC
jgi:hypothetical protein